MFEGHNAAYAGFLEGVNRRMARDADAALQSWKDATAAWKAACSRLESQLEEANARIAELELALAVEQAVAEAGEKVLDEWKALHPQSPLRQVVGKLKDGKPLTKSMSIWNTAFDAAARKRGITNPLAYRIS
jgi:uncharacterized coiled-coil protein SlyX